MGPPTVMPIGGLPSLLPDRLRAAPPNLFIRHRSIYSSMTWSFPVLQHFPRIYERVRVLASPLEPERTEEGIVKPAYPPPVHPHDPGVDYTMMGTYKNKYDTLYNVIYWPDYDAYSFHFAEGAAQGHSADRTWYATKEAAVGRIEAM
jgi:hypothetical protein